MDGRDIKSCRDLSLLSRNVEYRLSLNCSYFFLSTTHLDVIISHLSNELRSNLIRRVSEDLRDSTCSPGAPNHVWEDEREGFITRHLDCMHGAQGMGTSVSPCLSGVQAWWTPLVFLPTLSHAPREVLHTKLFRVVGPQKHEAQGKERNGLAPSSEEWYGQVSPGQSSQIASSSRARRGWRNRRSSRG